jgi:hypothetical protein
MRVLWAECTHALIPGDATRMGSYRGRVRQHVGMNRLEARGNYRCMFRIVERKEIS